ncbi:MAG: hypothetical protein GY710_05915 [Desulfobacteraceae bacterium]|nr:hypothetical protein [Desulfobacteraceae bacterium]
MTAKRKGLADKIKEHQGKIVSLSDGFNLTKKTSAQVDTCTPEQVTWTPAHVSTQVSEHVDTCTPEQVPTQQDNRTPEHPNNSTPTQVNTCTPEQVGVLNNELKPKDLKTNQYFILSEIYFKRPFKVKGPDRIGIGAKIPYGSVRNILKSLTKKGYITKPFSINDGVNKGTTCQINELKCIPVFGPSHIINSEHVNNRAPEHLHEWTPAQQDNRTREHVNTSYNKERKIYNISFFLKNSEFWNSQGLTLKKCETWIEEIEHCNPEYLLQQLQFGEAEPKVVTADRPVYYFHKIIVKDGLTRPAGFEFPEEKRARIQQKEMKHRDDLLRIQEEIRTKEKKITDKENFLAFLGNVEMVQSAIDEIESQFISSGMKISIQAYRSKVKIDSRLEGRLRQAFFNL